MDGADAAGANRLTVRWLVRGTEQEVDLAASLANLRTLVAEELARQGKHTALDLTIHFDLGDLSATLVAAEGEAEQVDFDPRGVALDLFQSGRWLVPLSRPTGNATAASSS